MHPIGVTKSRLAADICRRSNAIAPWSTAGLGTTARLSAVPEAPVTLDLAGLARLDQVLLGLLDETSGLPLGDRYLDEEGTPVATRNDGKLVGLRETRWARPEDVRRERPVAVAGGETLPAGELPTGVLVLLPLGGVRPDDARATA